MALSPSDLHTLINLVRSDPEARRQFQSALEMDALLELPVAVKRVDQRLDRLVEVVADLGAAQRRTEESLRDLAAAQKRTEDRLGQLEEIVGSLAEAQKRTEDRLGQLEEIVRSLAESVRELRDELSGLSRWQRGEAGRREGEQYERRIQRNAVMLLNGGQGGAPEQSIVQERMGELYSRLPSGDLLPDDESPSLADIVWWKANSYAVVEVSIKVDANDIVRAARRAETLRRSGVTTLPVVIGEEWAGPDTEERAQARGVEWKIGSSLSAGFLAYRRLAV